MNRLLFRRRQPQDMSSFWAVYSSIMDYNPTKVISKNFNHLMDSKNLSSRNIGNWRINMMTIKHQKIQICHPLHVRIVIMALPPLLVCLSTASQLNLNILIKSRRRQKRRREPIRFFLAIVLTMTFILKKILNKNK